MNRGRGVFCAVFAAFVLLLALPVGVGVAGSRNYDGVAVSIDDPLDGESGYGYVSYRVVVSNRSKRAHRVRVQIPASSYGYGSNEVIDRMTQTVEVGPGEATSFEMLQPPLPIQGSGAAIYIDGARQRRNVNVNMASHMGYGVTHLVMVSRDVGAVLKDNIDKAIEAEGKSGSVSGGYGGYGGGYGGGGNNYTLAREPRPVGEWGTRWLGYTRYMAVMMTDRDFASMPAELSNALRSYVLAGGTLAVVYSTDDPPLLGDWSQRWPASQVLAPDARFDGSADYGLGTVRLIQSGPAEEWDSDKWIELLRQWQGIATSRSAVRDTESANRDFPIVEGQVTPAVGLLWVMLLFSVVIGPVNVVVLWMMKRRMWLLVTVPVIALFFSGAVMVYALLSEGITPQARTSAVTLLDQRSHWAVTVGVSGYYAPLTPAGGLRYDENTLITPQVDRYGYGYYGGSGGGRSRSLDTTHGQHLVSGWVAARIPAHFVLRKSESRRERLEISTDSDGAVSVVNGLGSDITQLILIDPDGVKWIAKDILAGQSTALTPSDPGTGARADGTFHITSIAELIRGDDWGAADKINRNPEDFLPPGSYYARLAGTPFLKSGLENLKEHRTDCVVLGYFGEAE
jgi:hypothetical protein